MIDQHVLDAVRAVARAENTPDVLVEAVVRRLLPSIRLVPQFPKPGQPERVGGCRVGGLPDLPAGVEWPRLSTAWKCDPAEVYPPDEPLPFLLQVNLAEVAPFDVANALPKSGLLSFFFLWEEEDDEGNVAYVLSSDPENGLQRRETPPDLPVGRLFRGLDLVPHQEWTVPSPEDTGVDEALVNQHLRFWGDLEGRVAEAQGLEDPRGGAPVHRLLGHPQLIQTPGLAEGTKLLLQVDSDPPRRVRGHYPKTGMTWGDCGRVYFLLNEEELKSHRFERPWPSVEMH